LIELEKVLGIIAQNFKEISHKRTVTRIDLRANDINSGPFFIYVYGNATPQTLYYTKMVNLQIKRCMS